MFYKILGKTLHCYERDHLFSNICMYELVVNYTTKHRYLMNPHLDICTSRVQITMWCHASLIYEAIHKTFSAYAWMSIILSTFVVLLLLPPCLPAYIILLHMPYSYKYFLPWTIQQTTLLYVHETHVCLCFICISMLCRLHNPLGY